MIGAALALVFGRTYTSDFSFTPQESTGGGGLSAIASDFGVNIGANASQSHDFYMNLIHTREILWRLLDENFTLETPKGRATFTLLDSIVPNGPSHAMRRDRATVELRKKITSRADLKTSVVTVSAKAPAAALALQLAERLITEINRFNAETRRSRAAAQRAFAELRVAEARVALRNAEDRSEAWLTRNKIFATSPELQYEKARLDRELGLRDQEYVAIMQQYQAARMEEVRNTPVITIIERPTLPVRPDPRGLVTKALLGGFLGFVTALLIGFVREAVRKSKTSHSDALAEFAELRAEIGNELRNPGFTLRRIFMLANGKNSAVPSPQ